jgi:exodeoxyribonuclease VII small subunit
MADNKSASFEASLARLQEIVGELEREGVELERAVALFDEGRTLIAQCEKMLAVAEDRLRQVATPEAVPVPSNGPDDDLDGEDTPF